jgi:glycosyltransferase involved in cell wall biosynthesis
LVSIIIPLYDRASLITQTLDTLISEKHNGVEIEVIIIDDGSTDGGAELIAKEYPWVRLLSQKNQGAPTARNYGLREAKGEYILYLDSDDLIEENFFAGKVNVLENNKEAVGVYGPFEYFDSESKAILPRHRPYPIIEKANADEHLKNFLGGWFIPCNAFLWRKDVLVEIGGQREDLIINQDVDLTFRALLRGDVIGANVPKALIRQHASDRVGILNSESKLKAILDLRASFLQELTLKGINNNSFNQALGRYLFNLWAQFRKTYPEEAKKCLMFSREIYPDLHLKGGALLRILSGVLGPVRATHLKSWIKEINH